jgi:CYTH domain-containing protein
MAIEIEHKYLIDSKLFLQQDYKSKHLIKQAYLNNEPEKTIRVRSKDNLGFITIKGKANGASRLEFEYEIPLNDAQDLIVNFGQNTVEKYRYTIHFEGMLWEVDEFLGSNLGLWVAEIELKNASQKYQMPLWILENVTEDHRYANSNLALNPFCSW